MWIRVRVYVDKGTYFGDDGTGRAHRLRFVSAPGLQVAARDAQNVQPESRAAAAVQQGRCPPPSELNTNQHGPCRATAAAACNAVAVIRTEHAADNMQPTTCNVSAVSTGARGALTPELLSHLRPKPETRNS